MPHYLERKTIRNVPGTVIKAAPLPKPELIEGFGTRERAGELCARLGYRHALVVTDQTLHGLGAQEMLTASLEAQGVACTLFCDIDSEPTVQIVEAGRQKAVECGADCIIALGGGSVLDSSKIIAIGAKHPSTPISHFLLKFAVSKNGTLPMINIPSTAGTVAEEVADDFLTELRREFVRQLGEHPEDEPEYPKLITPAVYEKCERLTAQYADRLVFGGRGNREAQRFAPTVFYPVRIDEDIVQHELFCPLLPVVPFRDGEAEALLGTIAEREHPLAMYVFTADRAWAKRVMRTQQFGGGCINEVCLHMMVKGVPLNGTGHSGMGAYHGEWGFREFTHPQTVLRAQGV